MTNELIKWNDQLMGAPSGVLVAVFAIALGYILKTLPFVNNKYIPATVVVFCIVTFMLVAPAAPDLPRRIWLARNLMLGAIIGFSAWTFHAQLLRRFVDPKLFKDDDDTISGPGGASNKSAPPPTDSANGTKPE